MSADFEVHPGDLLAGKYRVERVVGRGAMGIVVKAVQVEGGVPCAVKLLKPATLGNPTAVERFIRETRATSCLKSLHVVRVLDVGTLESGAPYMAMEYLDGSDLGALLKHRGAIPPHEAALYVMHACEALAEAHAVGIVHRDIKPRNLFLVRGPNGAPRVKVLDFGISKDMGSGSFKADLTLTKAVLGSPAYMSPEQVMSPRDVDARGDVWSLGVVLYQLVTGRLPFHSEDAREIIAQVIRADPAPPSLLRHGLPHALDGVILRCLEKDPALRFQSTEALRAALDPFVPALLPGSEPPLGALAGRRRRVGLVALGVVGVAALAAGIAVSLVVLR